MQELLLHTLPLAAVIGYLVASFGYITALRQRGDLSLRFPRLAGIVGCISHTLFLLLIAGTSTAAPAQLFFELPATLSLIAVLVLFLFFLLEHRLQISGLGIVVAPLALFLMLWSSVVFHLHRSGAAEPSISSLLLFHWSTMVIGFTLLVLAFSVSVGVIVHETSMKRRRFSLLQQKLPPLVLLDRLQFQLLCLGLLFAATGVVVGLLIGEPRTLRYDPGVLTALLTLVIYSVTVLIQLLKGWRGKRAAWLSVCGFCTLLASLIGLSFSADGFHVF